MKKILALLLAVLMLLSCTALAFNPTKGKESSISFTPDDGNTDNSELVINDSWISRHKDEDGTTGDVKTELWLQVEASGQIDVTVPLILVFSTNVDGGQATAAENYKIYNNNPRNSIAVDKISVVDEGSDKMSFVGSISFNGLNKNARDYYSVTLKPEVADATAASGNQGTLKDSLDMHSQVHVKEYDLYHAQEGKGENGDYYYDETDDTHESLMTLGQGGIINLKPTMKTTPLTFVTKEYNKEAAKATHGVKLLTVTYTVGLQYTNDQGVEITKGSDLSGSYYKK